MHACVFCGIEYSGIHIIFLAILYKLVELNADYTMKIATLLNYVERGNIGKTDSACYNEFMNKLHKILVAIKDRCEKVTSVVLKSFAGEFSEDDKKVVAENIGYYNLELVKEVGDIGETYIEQRDGLDQERLDDVLFGGFGSIIKKMGTTDSVKLAFVFGQILSELRRIARFPRNLAVISLALSAPKYVNLANA